MRVLIALSAFMALDGILLLVFGTSIVSYFFPNFHLAVIECLR